MVYNVTGTKDSLALSETRSSIGCNVIGSLAALLFGGGVIAGAIWALVKVVVPFIEHGAHKGQLGIDIFGTLVSFLLLLFGIFMAWLGISGLRNSIVLLRHPTTYLFSRQDNTLSHNGKQLCGLNDIKQVEMQLTPSEDGPPTHQVNLFLHNGHSIPIEGLIDKPEADSLAKTISRFLHVPSVVTRQQHPQVIRKRR